ncbi:unknown [Firmicutes bacterium CAG:240]|nr:unknown [Firmicutes bacterium CAG:240]
MQCVGHRHAQCAQRGVARGDGQDDNAEQSDDAADTAEDILADYTDGFGCEGCVGRLKTEVINAHCACRPNHCDEALEDHHVIEGVASLTLALHGARDDSRLGGMEAGEYAAGDGYEEYREEVAVCEILAVVEHAVIFPNVVPHLNEGIALDKQADENADCREQQDAAEDRVNAADDLVDGEYGRN